jgi:hypothetical protein
MEKTIINVQLKTRDLRYFVWNNFVHNYPIYILSLACFFLFNQVLQRQYAESDKIKIILLALGATTILWIGLAILFQLVSKLTQTEKFLETRNYTFSPEKITVTWREQSYDINWKDLNRINQNRYYYYFHLNASQALIIPKRCINTFDQKILHQLIKKFNKKNR